jgi:hypothetical protein
LVVDADAPEGALGARRLGSAELRVPGALDLDLAREPAVFPVITHLSDTLDHVVVIGVE